MSFNHDLDRLHALVLETQEGPSLSDGKAQAWIQEALRDLCTRYPGVRVPGWRSNGSFLELLVDLGRSDEDILRLVLHVKRVLRDRLGGPLQWKWGYLEMVGADPEAREKLYAVWGAEIQTIS
jgi:hypothetical protein